MMLCQTFSCDAVSIVGAKRVLNIDIGNDVSEKAARRNYRYKYVPYVCSLWYRTHGSSFSTKYVVLEVLRIIYVRNL